MTPKKNSTFVNRSIVTPWGPIGYVTFKRTYARRLNDDDPNSPTEEFPDVVERELDSCDNQLDLHFTDEEKRRYAETRLGLKWSVAGRFMWQMGSKTVDKLGLPSLQNCSFVVVDSPVEPFTWAFDMLMLGSGVGFNIQREYVYAIPKLKGKIKIERRDTNDADFIVPDTREGWVKLLGKVLKAHFYGGKGFTYSTVCVRGKGAPIKGFGGVASGPEELCEGIAEIHKILNSRAKKKLRPIDCLDIMNIIGDVVVSGNVRRSAQIAIGDYDDLEYLKAKRWDLGPIPNWRGMSNNSVVTPKNMKDLPEEFWQTYKQGEPYGLINLELARSCGRVGDTKYKDENVTGFNPCMREDCRLLTPFGIRELCDIKIGDTVWSKEGWTKVVNKWSTGVKSVYEVRTTGGVANLTLNHRVDSPFGKKEVGEAESILTIGGVACRDHFEATDAQTILDGAFFGDGYYKTQEGRDYSYPLLIVGSNDKDYYDSEVSPLIHQVMDEREGDNCTRVITTTILPHEKDRTFNQRIPERFVVGNRTTVASFLRGLYTANGSVVAGGGYSARITLKTSSTEVRDQAQMMLSSLGIRSYFTTNKAKKVAFSNGEYECRESYDVNISSDALLFMEKIGFIQKYKTAKFFEITQGKYKPQDKQLYTKKVEETYLGEFEVFDITVDNPSHTFWCGGLSISNCAEQSLESFESCCLSELYLPRINSYEEFLEVISYAYRVCKHSLRLPCHLKQTEAVVHKNMRMGIGITGVVECSEEQLSWLPKAYEWLREYDKEYSTKHNWPISIKLTTLKPSGTLSLLPGVTPGVHPSPAGPYYIRRVRVSSNSPLLEVLRKHGVHVEPLIEFDGTIDKTTFVAAFPCMVGPEIPVAANAKWKDQLELVKRLQRDWSDNSVSCTVYYQKEDVPEIRDYLEKNMSENFKTVSFLLYQDHGFKQAPYETITKEAYDEMMKTFIPISSIEDSNGDDFKIDECAGGSCPIK